jgi:hypothetical protein
MNNEKFQVNLPEGATTVEVTIREGSAPKAIDPKPPVKTNITGTLGAVVEYLAKRVTIGQFAQERAHLLVNREDVTLTLVINEDDEYQRGSENMKHAYRLGLQRPCDNGLKKGILLYKDGQVINTFPSIRDMCRKMQFDRRSVQRVLSGTWKHTKGYTFVFENATH